MYIDIKGCPGCSVESQCEYCDQGLEVITSLLDDEKPYHWVYGDTAECSNYDNEWRQLGEYYGWHTFAWLPKRCRNGRWRWLTSLERHDDGTYTLGNRAH